MKDNGPTAIALLLALSFIFLPYASGWSGCSGVFITSSDVSPGKDAAFVRIDVYYVFPNGTNFTSGYPPEGDMLPHEYLFYVNESGAYFVLMEEYPSCSLAGGVSHIKPIVGYYNGSWYLLLDHWATETALPRKYTYPKHIIGVYRFNGTCLTNSTVILNNDEASFDLVPSNARTRGDYIIFQPGLKSQIGYYFNVSKALLNRYFGPSTTGLSTGAMALADGKSLLLIPEMMFMNCSNRYYLVKPVSSDLLGEKFNYSAVKSYSNWSEMPYYGVLWYPRGFIPLLKYDPTEPGGVTLAPNVKMFHVPLCAGASKNGTVTAPKTPTGTTMGQTSSTPTGYSRFLLPLGLVAGALFGVLIGYSLARRRRESNVSEREI
ncbi:hypothetical protein [Thermococcus sp. 21S7]|uniref:hypothetical protein n=1 Tax=Thermococcus sp. 21S7 TaxID=1638221 RepID=UPI00143CA08A|nr:hypothetical protein [Thermococcus sp. 21S7]NJE61738.1 hypothetical protein [Thermococcus sp. 21S7]